jgi:hypothetical protein
LSPDDIADKLLVLPDTQLAGFVWTADNASRILRFRTPGATANAWGTSSAVGQLSQIFKRDDRLLVGEDASGRPVRLALQKIREYFEAAQQKHDADVAEQVEFLSRRAQAVRGPPVVGQPPQTPHSLFARLAVLPLLALGGSELSRNPPLSVSDDVTLGTVRCDSSTTPSLYEPAPVVSAAPWRSDARTQHEQSIPPRILTPWMLLGSPGTFSDTHVEPHDTHVHVTLLFGGSSDCRTTTVGKLFFVEAKQQLADALGMEYKEFARRYVLRNDSAESWCAIPMCVGDTFIVPPRWKHFVLNVSPTFAVARNFCGS